MAKNKEIQWWSEEMKLQYNRPENSVGVSRTLSAIELGDTLIAYSLETDLVSVTESDIGSFNYAGFFAGQIYGSLVPVETLGETEIVRRLKDTRPQVFLHFLDGIAFSLAAGEIELETTKQIGISDDMRLPYQRLQKELREVFLPKAPISFSSQNPREKTIAASQ